MALPAEVEYLAVIPDESCPLARVAGGSTEVALLNAHFTTFTSELLLHLKYRNHLSGFCSF